MNTVASRSTILQSIDATTKRIKAKEQAKDFLLGAKRGDAAARLDDEIKAERRLLAKIRKSLKTDNEA